VVCSISEVKGEAMTITTIEHFYATAMHFALRLDNFVDMHDMGNIVRADHICYKCDSSEEFESMRALFEHESAYVYQSIISKRRIACIRLARGITTSIGIITCLELSDQKPDGSQACGFDHVEIYPIDMSYDALVEHCTEKGIVLTKDEKPHHTTYNTTLPDGFEIKLTHEPLIEKIKREEMKP
jgi:predicted metalloenzyme YecM